jgi:hypothetical protein
MGTGAFLLLIGVAPQNIEQCGDARDGGRR